ncbi:MAG: YdcF family protein [Alphaproteobacteria bacterium]|nr:YdcF family protein [Alphaproteobacteria bacterium]
MMKKIGTAIALYIGTLLIALWIIGFGVFCLYALHFKYAAPTRTDAIVVLTGGADRIQTALNLLQNEFADYLFISGVNKSVAVQDVLKAAPPELLDKITPGYKSENTRENAIEATDWILARDARSVLLVTSFYHMPRAILELARQHPALKILPLPVFPKSFDDSVEWIKTRTAWLLFLEYNKYLLVRLRYSTERTSE